MKIPTLLEVLDQNKIIVPKKNEVPIIAINKWQRSLNFLEKKFLFRKIDDRNLFIEILIEYEKQIEHSIHIEIYELSVNIKLQTKNINIPTEIDKEISKYLDLVYKDICYSPNDLLQITNDY